MEREARETDRVSKHGKECQSGKEVFKHAVLCRVCALLCAVLYAVRETHKVSKHGKEGQTGKGVFKHAVLCCALCCMLCCVLKVSF